MILTESQKTRLAALRAKKAEELTDAEKHRLQLLTDLEKQAAEYQKALAEAEKATAKEAKKSAGN